MKKLAIILFTVFASVLNTFAQTSSGKQVVLCEDYDKSTGVATGINKNWDIKAEGSYVYVIYSQDKLIKEDLKLYVDKKNGSGDFIAYGTYYFNNDIKENPAKWAMYDLKFTEQGDYKITVIGKSENTLAVTYSNIGFMVGEDVNAENLKKSKKTTSNNDEIDTYYYENSEMTFGESISEGVLSGEATTFKLNGSSKEIKAKIEQDEDLKLTQVVISIYTGTDYKEKVSELSYTIEDPTWNWISVPIKFYKKGKYVVDAYSQDDVFINSGYFEVK